MTPTKTIADLITEAHANSIAHGFWEANNDIGNKLMLVNTELCEFFERYRKGDTAADEHCPAYANQKVEIADAFIRLFDLCGHLVWLDIQEVIEAKMKYNESRPYLHGKKF
jgi:hypothetical protein